MYIVVTYTPCEGGNICHCITREVPLEPKNKTHQVHAHTKIKDPYKYQESRCQCLCGSCTHLGIHLDHGPRATDPILELVWGRSDDPLDPVIIHRSMFEYIQEHVFFNL